MEVLNTHITEKEIYLYLQKLKAAERINLFKKFSDDFLLICLKY